MTRSRRSLCAALLLLGVALPACSDRPERIVLVVVDTLRRDHVSAYGDRAETPHIDALAARGQRIDGASASFHQTTMSMGALFTGRTPSLESGDPAEPLPWNGRTWCGMSRFVESTDPRSRCLPAELTTLGEAMREAGYWTVGVTSNPLLYRPAGFDRGFDAWSEVGRVGPRQAPGRDRLRSAQARAGGHVNEAVAEALAGRPHDRFFLYVHYMDVHDYGMRRIPYAQGVREADAAVGGLMERLAAEGLLEDAVVVLTSDHGERLGERHPVKGGHSHYGNPSFEYLVRVPLLVAPAAFDRPPALVRSEDLYELLRELAGADPDGAPPAALRPEELFLTEARWQTYREGRWKSLHARAGGRRLLFDLEQDPEESRDAGRAHAERLEAHTRRVEELSRALAGRSPMEADLTPRDRERLRSLGYLE